VQLLSCHAGKLLKVDSTDLGAATSQRSFATGLSAIDALLPNAAFARGAIHEVLWTGKAGRPLFFAAVVARASSVRDETATLRVPCPPEPSKDVHRANGSSARMGMPLAQGSHSACSRPPNAPLRKSSHQTAGVSMAPGGCRPGRIVWCDPRRELYPPALAAAGIALDQLLLLRPRTAEEEIWALAECLACKGVAATIATPPPLSRVQARRLQLAAERGGGVGLLLRRHGSPDAAHHAAVTRWLVEPARGERTVQRWKIQLIHGHGGRLHQPVYLEYCRDRYQPTTTDRVRATAELADRPATKKAKIATA
jgi:protein ImuA